MKRTDPSSSAPASGRAVPVWYLCAWTVIFVLIVLTVRLPAEHAAYLSAGSAGVTVRSAFSLHGTRPDDYFACNGMLFAKERHALVMLNGEGRELTAYGVAGGADLAASAGRAVTVRSAESRELLVIDSAGEAAAYKATGPVKGVAVTANHVVTLEDAAGTTGVLRLFDAGVNEAATELRFANEAYPVAVAAVPGEEAFAVTVLDLSSGHPVTRLQRFECEGTAIFDRELPFDEPLPGLCMLQEDRLLLHSDRLLVPAVFTRRGAGREPVLACDEGLIFERLDDLQTEGSTVLARGRREGEERIVTGRPTQGGWQWTERPISALPGGDDTLLCLLPEGRALVAADGGTLTLLNPVDFTAVAARDLTEHNDIVRLLGRDATGVFVLFADRGALVTFD